MKESLLFQRSRKRFVKPRRSASLSSSCLVAIVLKFFGRSLVVIIECCLNMRSCHVFDIIYTALERNESIMLVPNFKERVFFKWNSRRFCSVVCSVADVISADHCNMI